MTSAGADSSFRLSTISSHPQQPCSLDPSSHAHPPAWPLSTTTAPSPGRSLTSPSVPSTPSPRATTQTHPVRPRPRPPCVFCPLSRANRLAIHSFLLLLPHTEAKINVPLENTPLFLFVGFVVSVGLGTLFWNYEKSDEVRKTPGPEVGRREDRFEPPLVKDHPPKKTD